MFKRQREEDDDDSGAEFRVEQRKVRPTQPALHPIYPYPRCRSHPLTFYQKPRTLPFRTSPTTKHTSLFSQNRQIPKPPTLTPAESSDDDSDLDFSSPELHPQSGSSAGPDGLDFEMDMDMTDSQPLTSPMWSPKTTNHTLLGSMPSPSYPRLLSTPTPARPINNANRVPTPIYPHFTGLSTPPDGRINTPGLRPPPNLQVSPAPRPASRPRISTNTEQQDAFLRRRRLPSPISEDENMDSPTNITKNALRDLDMSATTPATQRFPEHDLMTPETPGFMPGQSLSSSTPTRWSPTGGRRRSDAVSGGGGEGGKVVFSMGFRADCEKCRERVPGHYSHVLRI